VVFTDRFPNASLQAICRTNPEHLAIENQSVDATRVPPELDGFRTLFSAFHHFEPGAARSILKDAADRNAGIGVFELSERSLRGVLSMLLMPLGVLVFTPQIRPFSWRRLFLTYVIPAVPFFILWDGLVSSLRTYSPDELSELARGLDSEHYRVEIGQCAVRRGIVLTYLLGIPDGRSAA
jgi:hypothetical protein